MPSTRPLLIALVVAFGLGALAATSSADTATLAVADANGMPDPVARVSRVMTITGTTTAPQNLYIKSRAAGGAPCAPSSAGDPGEVPFRRPVG